MSCYEHDVIVNCMTSQDHGDVSVSTSDVHESVLFVDVVFSVVVLAVKPTRNKYTSVRRGVLIKH